MSGFVGIVHFDGCPVDRQLLLELTESLAFRAPDGSGTWIDGSVGLGTAALATTGETRPEQLPLSFQDDLWIVADARIDGRRELIAELEGRGQAKLRDATDAELILHAYRAWGDAAAEHLLGDFTFAIWDRARQHLFCARDHFGIKPFYYAEQPDRVVFSNTLSCLRRHPTVTSELNELAVADALLFQSNLDLETTTFAGVSRLPPAHSLTWSSNRRVQRRYWQLCAGASPPAESEEDWVERFNGLFETAVEERLRTDRVAVLMSGGLDSTAVAATADGLYAKGGLSRRVEGFTLGYDRLIPCQEGRYARLVADRFSMPLQYLPLDDYRIAQDWERLPPPPEPGNQALAAVHHELDRRIAERHRVVLTGIGGDSVFAASTGYFVEQLRRARVGRALRYLLGTRRRYGVRPPLGLHSRWLAWRGRRSWRDGYPAWLDPDLEARFDLEGRWRWYWFERRPEELHPIRPEAQRDFWNICYLSLLERLDAGTRSFPIEQRHPFLDVRLVEAVMALPPVPWCLDKHLLREAMRGVLPEAVRRRPKAPLAGYPRHGLDLPESLLWQGLVRRAPAATRFVQPRKLLDHLRQVERAGTSVPYGSEIHRALSLAHWLAKGVVD